MALATFFKTAKEIQQAAYAERLGLVTHLPERVSIPSCLAGHSMFRTRILLTLLIFSGLTWGQSDPSSRPLLNTGVEGANVDPGNLGSSYIPLDSWVYAAVERLQATGWIEDQFLGLRPWTRVALAQIVDAAQQKVDADPEPDPEVLRLVTALHSEFAPDLALENGIRNRSMRIESVYSRSMYISGQPLNDSYHFGQTIINDFGRPSQRGFNAITGFTARAEEGHFTLYVSGEYQHSPGAAAYPLSVRQVTSQADNTPLQPGAPFAPQNDFRLLDSYVSMTLLGQDLSFGKQSLWWGPGEGGAMIAGDNAEPFYMLRMNRVLPMHLPSVLRFLGPVRYDAFFGRLAGHNFPPRPFMHGEKFSFKPTENLEFGFSRTAVFAGQGITPLTFDTLFHTYFSATSSTGTNASLSNSPGARHGSFDFSYRVPFLRDWLTLYTDSLVHDDISPIDAPRHAAINPGIYLSRFPGFHRLDFRAEAVNTDPPTPRSNGGHYIYWEGIYRDVYTNKGNLLGSWIGREGKGVQAWSTYWLNPQSTIQFGYRNAKVAKDFIPQGETINDFSIRARVKLSSDWGLESFVQYERWAAPVLAPAQQSNVTGSIQLTFWPKNFGKTSHDSIP